MPDTTYSLHEIRAAFLDWAAKELSLDEPQSVRREQLFATFRLALVDAKQIELAYLIEALKAQALLNARIMGAIANAKTVEVEIDA